MGTAWWGARRGAVGGAGGSRCGLAGCSGQGLPTLVCPRGGLSGWPGGRGPLPSQPWWRGLGLLIPGQVQGPETPGRPGRPARCWMAPRGHRLLQQHRNEVPGAEGLRGPPARASPAGAESGGCASVCLHVQPSILPQGHGCQLPDPPQRRLLDGEGLVGTQPGLQGPSGAGRDRGGPSSGVSITKEGVAVLRTKGLWGPPAPSSGTPSGPPPVLSHPHVQVFCLGGSCPWGPWGGSRGPPGETGRGLGCSASAPGPGHPLPVPGPSGASPRCSSASLSVSEGTRVVLRLPNHEVSSSLLLGSRHPR